MSKREDFIDWLTETGSLAEFEAKVSEYEGLRNGVAKSWKLAAEDFGFSEDWVRPGIPEEMLEGEGADFDRDMHWAYNNMHLESISVADAPSGPAYAMWSFARSATKEFMKHAMDYFKRKSEERRSESALTDDARTKFVWIDKILGEECNAEDHDPGGPVREAPYDQEGQVG